LAAEALGAPPAAGLLALLAFSTSLPTSPDWQLAMSKTPPSQPATAARRMRKARPALGSPCVARGASGWMRIVSVERMAAESARKLDGAQFKSLCQRSLAPASTLAAHVVTHG
jgi:hypothetical protein